MTPTSEYIIGKTYSVLCAELMHYESGKVIYVPIIGPLHKDPEFGADFKHYHIDGRFANRTGQGLTVNKEGYTNQIVVPEELDIPSIWEFKRLVHKRKKCKSITTGLIEPPKNISKEIRPKAFGFWQWKESMIGKSCKGKKCPHRGQEMHEFDGKLVCPLHGLIGDIKTETIIA